MRLVALVIAGVLACSNASGTVEDVEKTFWRCDYAAASGLVDASEGVACGANFEDLKKTKFNGDFGALLAWWQKNKAAEHRARAKMAAAYKR